MSPVEMISNQMMVFAGIILFLTGIFGNLLNICVFAIWSRSPKRSHKSHRSGRKSNSSLYLLASSFANSMVIIYPLFTRIMFDGYQYRVTPKTVFFLCKLRFYVLHTFDLISLTCICLATFDRYLISSRKVRIRELSTRRQRTKLIILFISCSIGIHSIPMIHFFEISPHGQCTILSPVYLYYYLYIVQIFFHGIIPIIFLSIFGVLTFQQLKKIEDRQHHHHHHHHHHHRRRSISSDKQLSRMLLLMSMAIILSSIPYCIEQGINVMFLHDDRLRKSYFYLFHVITHILYYTNPVSSFYIYYISTPNFRIQVRKILFCQSHVHYVVSHDSKNTPSSQQSTSANK